MKQVNHHNSFSYHIKYKSFSVTFILVLEDIFGKIDSKTFFFFMFLAQ